MSILFPLCANLAYVFTVPCIMFNVDVNFFKYSVTVYRESKLYTYKY